MPFLAFLPYIAAILTGVGAVASFVGQKQAAAATEEAGKAQAKAAAAAAHNEELQTAEAVRRERVNKRRRLARMRADVGASGLVMDGSTMDTFAETAGIMELQIQDSARAGAMNAQNIRSQGDMALWEARTSAGAQRFASYGTLLQGGASLANLKARA
jgi:hypothetical protein